MPAAQLEDQLIECDLGLAVGAGKADQLTIQIHGVIVGSAVVDDLFAVHARASFQVMCSRQMELYRYAGSIAQMFLMSSGDFCRFYELSGRPEVIFRSGTLSSFVF